MNVEKKNMSEICELFIYINVNVAFETKLETHFVCTFLSLTRKTENISLSDKSWFNVNQTFTHKTNFGLKLRNLILQWVQKAKMKMKTFKNEQTKWPP